MCVQIPFLLCIFYVIYSFFPCGEKHEALFDILICLTFFFIYIVSVCANNFVCSLTVFLLFTGTCCILPDLVWLCLVADAVRRCLTSRVPLLRKVVVALPVVIISQLRTRILFMCVCEQSRTKVLGRA